MWKVLSLLGTKQKAHFTYSISYHRLNSFFLFLFSFFFWGGGGVTKRNSIRKERKPQVNYKRNMTIKHPSPTDIYLNNFPGITQ